MPSADNRKLNQSLTDLFGEIWASSSRNKPLLISFLNRMKRQKPTKSKYTIMYMDNFLFMGVSLCRCQQEEIGNVKNIINVEILNIKQLHYLVTLFNMCCLLTLKSSLYYDFRKWSIILFAYRIFHFLFSWKKTFI